MYLCMRFGKKRFLRILLQIFWSFFRDPFFIKSSFLKILSKRQSVDESWDLHGIIHHKSLMDNLSVIKGTFLILEIGFGNIQINKRK